MVVLLIGKLSLAYLLGLILPGYCIARHLNCRTPWSAAIPLSLLVLVLCVLLLSVLSTPLTFWAVLALESVVVVFLGVPLLMGNGSGNRLVVKRTGPPPLRYPLLAGISLVCLIAVWIGYMVPLSGYDTLFRWEFLARQILRYQTLDFYPPVTPADFQVYFYPDGFAPIVSTGYWLIYAAIGKASPVTVMPLVVMQYVSLLGIGFHLSRQAASPLAGWLTCGILVSSPLFFKAVMIGQETGLTALALAGSVAALLDADDGIDLRALILAGLFSGTAALAREYGVALAVISVYLVFRRGMGWRGALVWGIVLMLVCAAWYGRNWLRCGNPLYSHAVGIFPVNGLFDSLMGYYRTVLGFGRFTALDWMHLSRVLLTDAFWPTAIGLPLAFRLWRSHGWMILGISVSVFLWVVSVAYTSGGYVYSMRVLSPAILFAAVAAGTGVDRICQTGRHQCLAVVVVTASTLYGAWCAAIFPVGAFELNGASPWGVMRTRFENPLDDKRLVPLVMRAFPPGSRLLAENAYAHSIIANAGVSYDLVPVWSPEVTFLLDDGIPPAEQRRKLMQIGIVGAIVLYDSITAKFLYDKNSFYRYDSDNWDLIEDLGGAIRCARFPRD